MANLGLTTIRTNEVHQPRGGEPTPSASRHIAAHTGLRGIAACLVITYHLQFGDNQLAIETATSFFKRGYLFVDLFFILSGFIISYTSAADRAAPFTAAEYGKFMYRRFARLYPLLLFTLVYLVIGQTVLQGALAAAGRQGPSLWSSESIIILVAQATMVNAWLPDPNAWNVPSWSISAEMFAYALFPLFVAIHVARPRLAILLLLAISVSAYVFFATSTGSLDVIGGLSPLRCVAGFSAGMIIFYFRRIFAAWSAGARAGVQLGAVAATVAFLVTPVNDVLLIPGFVLLVAATWTDQGPLAQVLSRSTPQFLGEISYSIYLNHVCVRGIIGAPLLYLLRAVGLQGDTERIGFIVIYLATVIGVSWLTFRFVEVPARDYLSRLLLGRPARPIAFSPPAP